jgi:hypothetical protein
MFYQETQVGAGHSVTRRLRDRLQDRVENVDAHRRPVGVGQNGLAPMLQLFFFAINVAAK